MMAGEMREMSEGRGKGRNRNFAVSKFEFLAFLRIIFKNSNLLVNDAVGMFIFSILNLHSQLNHSTI